MPAEPAGHAAAAPCHHAAIVAATSRSLRRSAWSPSTNASVTSPGMAAHAASSSSGVPKGSRPGHEAARHHEVAEVLGAEPVGLPGRVQRVADEDEGRDVEPHGGAERAHAPPERPATDRDLLRRDAKLRGELARGAPDGLDADRRRVRTSPTGRLGGELDPRGHHAERREGLVDRHEARLVLSPACARGEHEPREPPHGAIMDRPRHADATDVAATRLRRWPIEPRTCVR